MRQILATFLCSVVAVLVIAASLPGADRVTAPAGVPSFSVDTLDIQDAPEPNDTTVERRSVEIIRADSLTGITVGGEPVRRLVGNVQLRQESTFLRAGRVTQYTTRDEILLENNVRITDEGDTLTADQVRYDTRNRVGHAIGNVRLTDGDVVVRAPEGYYYYQERRAEFQDGVVLEDTASVLTSREGQYFVEDKRAEFTGSVVLTGDRSILEADSVIYFRDTEISDATGNVFIERWGDDTEEPTPEDSLRRTLLWGETAYNEPEQGYSRVRGNALLVRLQADSLGAEPDTLMARSVQMESIRQESLDRVIAVGAVHTWQRDLSAIADSVVYDRIILDDDREENEARLFKQPIAWFEDTQLQGDSIRTKGYDGSIDSLFVRNNAFVGQEDEVLGKIQQLQGRNLTALFEQDSLRFITVGPNAEMIRFMKNDEDELDGAVEGSSDDMDFWFEQGELAHVKMRGQTEGLRYPAESLPDPLELSRFAWYPEQRPTREGFLTDLRILQRLTPERDDPTIARIPPKNE